MMKSEDTEKKQNNGKMSDEAKNNLLGFFDLLLKIDGRVNPQRYKSKKAGYYRVSQKGSHIKIRNDARQITLIIPDHKEVDRWTLRGIIGDSELTVKQFIELLK